MDNYELLENAIALVEDNGMTTENVAQEIIALVMDEVLKIHQLPECRIGDRVACSHKFVEAIKALDGVKDDY